MKINKYIMLFMVLILPSLIFSQNGINKLTKEEKILGLSIIWKEVSYNFAYFERLPDLNWDEEYEKYISKVINSKSDLEYYIVLQDFMNLLQERHAKIIIPQHLMREYYSQMKKQWFIFEWIEEDVFATHCLKSISYYMPLGSKIVEINGVKTKMFFSEVMKNKGNSTFEHTRKRVLKNELMYEFENYPKYIKYITPNGHEQSLRFDTVVVENDEWIGITELDMKREMNRFPTLSWLGDSIAFLDIAGDMDENLLLFFDSIYPAIKNANGLIVDLRYSQGGSSVGNYIISHFTKQDTIKQFFYTRNNNAYYRAFGAYSDSALISFIGGNARYGQFADYHKDKSFVVDTSIYINPISKSKRISLPLVFLIDNFVGSATEDLLISLKAIKLGTIVGEPTAGSCTQPLVVKLPGNGFALIATQKTMLNETEVFTFIKPDVEVKRTLEEILSGKDKILEVGLEVIKDKIRKKEK